MIPLTGTSSEAHMREDLAVLDPQHRTLSPADVRVIEKIAR
jgi:hypothetical protein